MEKPNILMIGDFGKDLDDENALLYALGAQLHGEATLSAIVANLAPEDHRARLVQGMLNVLGIAIPVAVGTSCNNSAPTHSYEMEVPYFAKQPVDITGTDILSRTLDAAADHSQTLVLNSGLTDAAELLRARPDAARRKLRQVAIMGGVITGRNQVVLDTNGYMTPDDAANNMFDMPAAEFVYHWLQAENIPMSILTRDAAYACYFGFDFYNQLAATGNPIGKAILDRHKPATNNLWRTAQLPIGHAERGELPDRCNQDWFIKTYLGGLHPGETEDVWAAGYQHGRIQLYDPLNVASVVRPDLFKPAIVRVNQTDHHVIGISPERHGIADIQKLQEHVAARELRALTN